MALHATDVFRRDATGPRAGDGRLSAILMLIGQPLLLNALSIPATAYIIRTLGAHAYGQWALANATVASLAVLGTLGLRMTFVRAVSARPTEAGEALACQLCLRMALTIVAGAVALAMGILLGYERVVVWCISLTAVGLVVSSLAGTSADLLQAVDRLQELAAANLAGGLALTAASVFVIWARLGPIGLSAAYVVGPVITAAWSLLVVRRHVCPVRFHWNVRAFRSLIFEGRWVGLQQMVGSAQLQLQSVLLTKTVGVAAYGFYAAGTLVPDRLRVVPDSVSAAFFPVIVRGIRSQGADLREQLSRFFAAMAVLCVSVSGAAFLLVDPIGSLLFPGRGEQFRLVMRISIWALPLVGAQLCVGYTLSAAGRDAEQALVAGFAGLASLAATVLLISRGGLIGASYAAILRPLLLGGVMVPVFVGQLRRWKLAGIASDLGPAHRDGNHARRGAGRAGDRSAEHDADDAGHGATATA